MQAVNKAVQLALKALENISMGSGNKAEILAHMESCQNREDVFLECDGTAILWGFITPMLHNSEIKVAKEIFWYSDQPTINSVKILKRYVKWAEEQGADYVLMESLKGTPKVDELYKKLGFKEVSTVFRKDL